MSLNVKLNDRFQLSAQSYLLFATSSVIVRTIICCDFNTTA